MCVSLSETSGSYVALFTTVPEVALNDLVSGLVAPPFSAFSQAAFDRSTFGLEVLGHFNGLFGDGLLFPF